MNCESRTQQITSLLDTTTVLILVCVCVCVRGGVAGGRTQEKVWNKSECIYIGVEPVHAHKVFTADVDRDDPKLSEKL